MVKTIPWRLIWAALLVLLALAGANHLAGFVPFTPQWSARRSAEQVKVLKADISTLQLEAAGNAEISQATENYHTREIVIREATAQAVAENRNAEDASTPLSAERVTRLHVHDRLLCERTGLCTDADPAGGGAPAVRNLDPAEPAGNL